ncbi:MAG: amino acid ABC transporter permease [Kiloniellales bacterium]
MAVETAGSVDRGIGSLWSDQRFRAIAVQIIVIVLLVIFTAFIVRNTAVNLEKRGIATGFGFLNVPAGFDIATSLIPYSPTMTHGRVFFVGLLNTVLVASLGVICATIIGFVVGVLRLSPNWLINRISYVYIEVVRNIPLLLQILFWWGVFLGLPPVRNAVSIRDTIFLSNRGLQVPSPIFEPGFSAIVIAFVVAIVAALGVRRWARKRQEATGQQFPVFWTGFALVVGLPLLVAVIMGMPLSFEVPEQRGFNYVGGFSITPEFTALWVALSVYTGAFIAENVRSGIQAVSHGQTEAAYALGLKPNWTMRLIIVPQALRVIVPPLTSQYLNLTKNSSLAIAVGYPDLVSVFANTSLNQTGQAIEIIAMTMAVYLSLSLAISAFMNWYNRKIALVER